LMCHNQDDSI